MVARRLPFIRISAYGQLAEKDVYIAHARGHWGPERDGDYLKNQMHRGRGLFVLSPTFLKEGEQFKIIVPVTNEREARRIYLQRMGHGYHVGKRFDFDSTHKTLWLLAENYPIIRPEQWNQNNVCVAFIDKE